MHLMAIAIRPQNWEQVAQISAVVRELGPPSDV
jgi:hypothetical protein